MDSHDHATQGRIEALANIRMSDAVAAVQKRCLYAAIVALGFSAALLILSFFMPEHDFRRDWFAAFAWIAVGAAIGLGLGTVMMSWRRPPPHGQRYHANDDV